MSPSLIRLFPGIKMTITSSTISHSFGMFLLLSPFTKIPILLKSFWILVIFLRLSFYSYFIFMIFKQFLIKLYVQINSSLYVSLNLLVSLLSTISCISCLSFFKGNLFVGVCLVVFQKDRVGIKVSEYLAE